MDGADRNALADAIDVDDPTGRGGSETDETPQNVDADDALADVVEHFDSRSYRGHAYWVYPDQRHGLERGTVVIDGQVVRGFPKIHRSLVLDPGISRHFDGQVYAEEKLNGYNVRIADVDAFDDPVAFTRSGLICPFTTARAHELLDLDAFFSEHPDQMLCGELVGEENPYTPHDYPEVDSHDGFVFDVRDRTTGAPLPTTERRGLVETYGFRQPRLLAEGPADELHRDLKAVIRDLDHAGREGVVVKSADGRTQLKYTTGQSNRNDLAHAFSLPFDYGKEFLFSRIVREGFQTVEFEEDEAQRRERARDLGESILLPLADAIETVDGGGDIREEHTVRGDPPVLHALVDHLEHQGLQLAVADERTEADGTVLEFEKHAAASTDKIRSYLDGHTYAK